MNTMKVLVVDDNVINQKVASKMLQRMNIAADVAGDGNAAVEASRQVHYDLILMDVQMPVMDGLEATKMIRAEEHGNLHTPIIALTANALQGDRERCLQSGMDDYLSKPIKQQDIDYMVKKWISPLSESLSETNSVSRSEEVSIIDPKRIEQIKEIGDDGLFRELLALYLEDLAQYSNDISLAHSQNNFQQIYECSHKLKGSSANLGVESIRAACIIMEQAANDADEEKITSQISVMKNLIERTRQHILITYPPV